MSGLKFILDSSNSVRTKANPHSLKVWMMNGDKMVECDLHLFDSNFDLDTSLSVFILCIINKIVHAISFALLTAKYM